MITNELLDYIRQQLDAGVSRDTITIQLMKVGWDVSSINEAFSASSQSVYSIAPEPPLQKKQVKPAVTQSAQYTSQEKPPRSYTTFITVFIVSALIVVGSLMYIGVMPVPIDLSTIDNIIEKFLPYNPESSEEEQMSINEELSKGTSTSSGSVFQEENSTSTRIHLRDTSAIEGKVFTIGNISFKYPNDWMSDESSNFRTMFAPSVVDASKEQLRIYVEESSETIDSYEHSLISEQAEYAKKILSIDGKSVVIFISNTKMGGDRNSKSYYDRSVLLFIPKGGNKYVKLEGVCNTFFISTDTEAVQCSQEIDTIMSTVILPSIIIE